MSETTSSARTAASGGTARATAAPAAQRTQRRQLALLAVLAVVLGALVVFVLVPALSGTSAPGGQPAPARAAATPGGRAEAPRREVVDVHLDRLKAEAPEPADAGRNPFRMGAATPTGSAAAQPAAPVTPQQSAVPLTPPGPPPVPPIPFKFIGIVTGSGRTGKIAVLSDGRSVVHGKEGETIVGQYRIVRIGEESIQIEHLNGRGRQTIRLSGQ